MRDENEDSCRARGTAQEIIKGGVTGGVRGAAVASVKALVNNRKTFAAAGLAILIVTLAVLGTISGSPLTSGVSHVNDVALNGSVTSGFEGAAQESGLGDDAITIAEYAESVGVPTELVLALVDTTRGPWRAAAGDKVAQARTVADALVAARDATSADGSWDMLAGTMA